MKSAPTIAFDYAPSRWIALATVLVCAGAVLAPWLSTLPLAACAGVSLAAAGFGAFALRRQWRTPFRRIACRASGWTLVDLADTEHEAILESHAHLGALMVLAFRHGPRARFRAVFGPDNLDAETRRRLILLLARAEIAHAR
jgi:toxin CptA